MTHGAGPPAGRLLENVTLLALADLSIRGQTPAYPFEVRTAIRDYIDSLSDEIIGMPDEAAISRALNGLEAEGRVTMADDGERSPVGKGRPAYSLQNDPETVVENLSTDDRLETAIERVLSIETG